MSSMVSPAFAPSVVSLVEMSSMVLLLVYLIARTIVGIINGSTFPLIIFCALKFIFSCSLFTPKLEALPSTLFFLLGALLGKIATTFFLFFNVVYISSLVLKTLANAFCGLSF